MATNGGRGGESLRGTLVDDVTERLRRAIVTGEIAPGQRIRVRDLEERFGVSHIPIRESLRSLEAEGLVENLPQRGAVATGVSLDELSELYDLRRILESAVAERAVASFDPERLQTIKSALERLEEVSDGVSDEFIEAHRNFHWAIMEPGATRLIERTLRQLWQTSERYVRLAVSAAHTGATGRTQHRRLYQASRSKNSERLRDEVMSHLHLTEGGIRAWYEQEGAAPAKAGRDEGASPSKAARGGRA